LSPDTRCGARKEPILRRRLTKNFSTCTAAEGTARRRVARVHDESRWISAVFRLRGLRRLCGL
jgi:hypothetical protein